MHPGTAPLRRCVAGNLIPTTTRDATGTLIPDSVNPFEAPLGKTGDIGWREGKWRSYLESSATVGLSTCLSLQQASLRSLMCRGAGGVLCTSPLKDGLRAPTQLQARQRGAADDVCDEVRTFDVSPNRSASTELAH